MDKKQMQMVLGVGFAALLLGFAGGNMYGKSHAAVQFPAFGAGQGQFAGNRGGNGGTGMMQGRSAQGGRGGAGALVGEITAKDDTSLTLKLRDGGSKIVFFSESTLVSKSVTTTPSDVAVGNTAMVDGTTNSDGSVTAKTINLNAFRMMGRPVLSGTTSTLPQAQ